MDGPDELSTARAAVDAFRASDTPAELALWLRELGRQQFTHGLSDQAITTLGEAIDIYAMLAVQDPERFGPYHVDSLTDLSARLAECGQREEALSQTWTAVRRAREVAATGSASAATVLAAALGTLTHRLVEVERHVDALAPIEEMVKLRRFLASESSELGKPEAGSAALARALVTMAGVLLAVNRPADALTTANEAVAIGRDLINTGRTDGASTLTRSLAAARDALFALNRDDEALSLADEAVTMLRPLARRRPDRFLCYLASALDDAAYHHYRAHQGEQARQAAEDAVEAYRRLVAEVDDRYLLRLALAYNNLANCLSDDGLVADSVAAQEQAVLAARKLARMAPERHTAVLTELLRNYADCLTDAGRTDKASRALAEASALD